MSVLDGPGEGTWSVFAAKVVEERDELRHKLAGEAAHIKSLEGLLVDAVRERDEARAALARTDRARRDSENAWEEEYDAMKRERDEARAHTSTAAFMRIEKQRDEARAELEGAKQMARGWEDVYRTEHSLRRETGGKLDETRVEVERLRTALRHLLLSRDSSWTGGHDWTDAVDDAIRALGIEVKE